jgi:regulatory protein
VRSRKPREDAKPLDAGGAFAYAVRALSQRALTEQELEKKLRARGASPEIITETLERLREYRFVDDAALAERAARETGVGERLIRMKLKMRGLESAVIEDAMTTREPETDLEAARTLAQRHRSKWVGERAYSKAYAFLSRRGFDGRTVQEVLRELRLNATERELALED